MPVVVTTEYPRDSSLSKICLGTSLLSQTYNNKLAVNNSMEVIL